MRKITAKDILRRAQELIRNNHEFEPIYTACQKFCPWCAASEAKGQLDEEYKTGISSLECLKQWMLYTMDGQINELPEDAPLVGARMALKPFVDAYESPLTQEESLKLLRKAEESLWTIN